MTHLIFADTRRGVLEAKQLADRDHGAEIVIVSAEAMEAAEQCGARFLVAADVGGGGARLSDQSEVFGKWFAALADLETRLAAGVPGCNFEDPGILLSRAYCIALAINAVRYRVQLMAGVIAAITPGRVTIVETDVDPTFREDGHERNPWTIALELWCRSNGVRADVVVPTAAPPSSISLQRATLEARARVVVRRLIRELRRLRKLGAAKSDELAGLRLLFSEAADYDWHPVAEVLRNRGAKVFVLPRQDDGSRAEDATYRRAADGTTQSPGSSSSTGADRAAVERCYGQWAAEMARDGRLVFSGVDTFRALSPYLLALIVRGPDLLRRTDAVVDKALEELQPHAVCFSAIAYPYQKRLAAACKRRAIPAIGYQHGGAYGTHEVPVHDFAEASSADFFVSYGCGVHALVNPVFPCKSQYIAAGSARLEQQIAGGKMQPRRGNRRRLRVVFAGDVSYRNTVTAGTEIEDTIRYRIERDVLSELAAGRHIDVIYRPFPYERQMQGTPAWLSRTRLRNVRSDASTKTDVLLRRTDLLVTLSTSGTLWNEALALGVPLVAHLDPRFTVVRAEFRADLGAACIVCTTGDEFRAAAHRIAAEGTGFLQRFADKRSDAFLRRYVLADGSSVETVVDFLAAIRGRSATQALVCDGNG